MCFLERKTFEIERVARLKFQMLGPKPFCLSENGVRLPRGNAKSSLISIKWCINQTNLRELILEHLHSSLDSRTALETQKNAIKNNMSVLSHRRCIRMWNKLTRLCSANHLANGDIRSFATRSSEREREGERELSKWQKGTDKRNVEVIIVVVAHPFFTFNLQLLYYNNWIAQHLVLYDSIRCRTFVLRTTKSTN